ncbi:DUF1835 domain-containing protein [Bacillus xiapuensis]|uniref:DUF1835 domain-containing protein n=1 Tax=Bacillus xiapuensis TaxID=2014075 RepID=UPI000C234109|nr:DUF1835 domain-containing protein [Bacillus xiapuensis]
MDITTMKKVMEQFSEEEVKSLLFQVFLRADLCKETAYSEKELAKDLQSIFESMRQLAKERSEVDQPKHDQKVHILFSDSAAGGVKEVLKKSGAIHKETVISFWEDFSNGPVWKLHEKSGEASRFAWKQQAMYKEDEVLQLYKQTFQKAVLQIHSIPEGVPIAIWAGENAHEQTGLRYVVYLLREKDNPVTLIHTSKHGEELLNQQNQGLSTGALSTEKLQSFYEQSMGEPVLSQEERKDLEKEWKLLSENPDTLRIWRNASIQMVPEDCYDSLIIQKAQDLHRKQGLQDFMKSARLIGEVLGELDQCVGCEFLEYRLRKLIEDGVFEAKGSLKAMRYYSVKLL